MCVAMWQKQLTSTSDSASSVYKPDPTTGGNM